MKRQSLFYLWVWPTVAVQLLLLPKLAQAKYIGAEPACSSRIYSVGSGPQVQGPSDTGTTISRTEGNLSERLDLSRVFSTFGATIAFTAVYNSYNADNSRAQIDTVMGYGWTHSYNTFLFSQLGAMFRFNGDGRVIKYSLGPGAISTATTGYFETLVKNLDNSFTLTQKDKTTFTFAAIPNTPFLVGGPVLRLTSIVDRNGNKTTLTYTAGNLTSIADTYGRSMTLAYTSQKKVAAITDPAGRVTTLQYDSTGRKLIKITDPNGNSIQYTYNFLYQLTGKLDKDGRAFSYVYVNNQPVAVNDSAGGARATLSNSNNWATDSTALAMYLLRVYLPSTTSNTDGRSNVWRYQDDANGCLTSAVAPDGATTTFSYDPGTLMLSSRTDANGHATTYLYDSQGNTTQMTDALGHITAYTYEPVFNMMTSMTDPRGRVTTFSYDSHGNRIQETDPLVQVRKWTYDSHGNVLSETDKNGHTTTYQYDAFGDRTKITDPLGNVTTITYDAVGNVLSRTDANSHTSSFQYDGLNRVTRETDPAGKTTQAFYDGEGDRVQIIDRNGHATSYQFDLRRRPIKTTDALTQTETYAYDGNDSRTSMTDRNGHKTNYGYDVQNRLNKTTDALGNITTTIYDPVGNVTSQTDANSHTTTNLYDSMNRRIGTTDAVGNVTQLGYDTGTLAGCTLCGATPGSTLVTKRTDGNGKVIYFKFDALDRQIDVVRKVDATSDAITSSDAVTVFTYDAVRNRLTVTEPDGNTITYQYDSDNRRTKATNAAGDVTTTTYDGVSNVTNTAAPNLNVTTNTYDALDRLTQVSDSVGLVSSYTYDAVGNCLSQADGNGNTTANGYDALNRLTTVTDPLVKTTTSQYDAVGNLVMVTDRDANMTTHVYDAINRRISTTNALGNTTQSQYDPVGNQTKLTDANSHASQYAYDAVNRVITETYADSTMRSYTYDGVANVLTRTDQKGQITHYKYNDLYFLTARTYSSANNDSFTYDLSGRMLTGQRGTWKVTFAYDGANRVIQTAQGGQTISYSYNVPGRTRTLTYPGRYVLTENTDARTRLDHINDASSPPSIVQYAYDRGNRVTSRNYSNGTQSAFFYNANNWITILSIYSTGTGQFLIGGFDYGYDNEGNRQYANNEIGGVLSEAYRYDPTYRLVNYAVGTLVGPVVPTPTTQTSYNLDPVGNWASKTTNAVLQTRAHNSTNELIEINSTTLTYDSNGNTANDGSYTYAYDEENRLTEITRNSDSAVVGQYQYDALGRRVKKIAPGPVTTQYFYDVARTIEEQDSLGVTKATYVYGNDIDEVLTMNRGGQTYFYHQNAIGSVVAVTSGYAPPYILPVERYAYDAYGLPTVTNGAGVPVPLNSSGTPHSDIGNPWMFTGRQLDEETGLYFYRARHYDDAKGRFLQRDPIGIWGDPVNMGNGYAYVGDNPTRWTDPAGIDTVTPGGHGCPGCEVCNQTECRCHEHPCSDYGYLVAGNPSTSEGSPSTTGLQVSFSLTVVPSGPIGGPLYCLAHPEDPGCWDLPVPGSGPISGLATYPAVRDKTSVKKSIIKPIKAASLAVRGPRPGGPGPTNPGNRFPPGSPGNPFSPGCPGRGTSGPAGIAVNVTSGWATWTCFCDDSSDCTVAKNWGCIPTNYWADFLGYF